MVIEYINNYDFTRLKAQLLYIEKNFPFQETIDEHKKNYVPGSNSDLIDLFLNEMYSGKGPDGGYDGEKFSL